MSQIYPDHLYFNMPQRMLQISVHFLYQVRIKTLTLRCIYYLKEDLQLFRVLRNLGDATVNAVNPKTSPLLGSSQLTANLFEQLARRWGVNFGKIFSITELNNVWSTAWNKIFSLSEINSQWSSTWNKIFQLSDLQSWITSNFTTHANSWINSLSTLTINSNSKQWIASVSDWIIDWVSENGGMNLKKFLFKYLTNMINVMMQPFGWVFIYDYTLDTLGIESYQKVVTPGTHFTIELAVYNAIAKLRNMICSVIEETIDFIDDVKPDLMEIFIPLFSSAGIRIAHKIDGEWDIDFEEWPETNDPDVMALYFELPKLPIIDIFHIRFDIANISKSNVYFYANDEWAKTRKYNTFDLAKDLFGFGGLTFVCFLLAHMGRKNEAETLLSKLPGNVASITSAIKTTTAIYNNTVNMNKSLAGNAASIAALINGLLGSAANTNAINNLLNTINFPSMPSIDLTSDDIDAILNSLDGISEIDLELDDLAKETSINEVKSLIGSSVYRYT